ncbi:DUF559 domain-containing protein [Microbacterium sp. X-17]|uniref:endonuclease domain-containing protein n=1 Tax=Microbacterium sp. X-17 TaxID=3144404 RepID=UPI0031F536D5
MLNDDLPRELGARFRVREALRAGVGPARLRRADLARPFRGARMRADADLPDAYRDTGGLDRRHLASALAFAPMLTEHEFFSHVTAAVILGLPVPPWLVAESPVHVSVLPPRRLRRATGVAGHEAMPHLTSIRTDPILGLPVTSPATTWAMLAALLPNTRDVVAVGDAAVREWRRAAPHASLSELTAAVRAGRRVGIERLRDALPLIRTRSASRPESWMRLTLVDAGLPEPELNHDVVAEGEDLGCVDLAYPRLRVAIEYEGDHHRSDPVQWARDIRRYERLAAAGWLVIRVTRTDLFDDPRSVLARVRVAIATRAA